jgi:hypothetical protein
MDTPGEKETSLGHATPAQKELVRLLTTISLLPHVELAGFCFTVMRKGSLTVKGVRLEHITSKRALPVVIKYLKGCTSTKQMIMNFILSTVSQAISVLEMEDPTNATLDFIQVKRNQLTQLNALRVHFLQIRARPSALLVMRDLTATKKV